LILAAVLAVIVANLLITKVRWGEAARRVRFRLTGAVQIDGRTLYLDPGDQILTQAVLARADWEPAETAAVRAILRPGDTFIDAGANVGWYTLLASRLVGPTGRVIAFEPEPRAFGLLARCVTANGLTNVVTERKALSDRPGKLTLYVNPINRGNHSLVNSFGGGTHIDVPTVALDGYLRDYRGDVALVKIDTEGAEGLILRGMWETIDRYPRLVIVMEFNPTWIRKTGVDPEAMLQGLSGRGFSIAAMEYSAMKQYGEPWPVPPDGIPALIQEIEDKQARIDPGFHYDLLLRRTGEGLPKDRVGGKGGHEPGPAAHE
jgi:FkbM family methyltransferase